MSNLTHTGIPTAGIFGMENAFGFNPVKGCDNKECHLHPINTGKCWAAQMCNRMAGPWAESELNYLIENDKVKCSVFTNPIEQSLKLFDPTWLESIYQKQFPKERSCILVGYMTDIAYIPGEWVQKIIDKINANNQEREKAGLLLHVFPFLTKDPSVYHKFKWPKNCWLGFTATNQSEFLSRYEEIMDPFKGENYSINQKYAYLEPLREEIKFPRYLNNTTETKWDMLWVIVGGGSTPLHPDWVRSIRDQCLEAGIPFYFKGFNWKGINIWGQWCKKFGERYPLWGNHNYIDREKWEQFPEVEIECNHKQGMIASTDTDPMNICKTCGKRVKWTAHCPEIKDVPEFKP